MSTAGESGSEAQTPTGAELASEWPRLGVAVTVFGVALCALILFLFEPSHHRFFPVCIFHQTTGLLCPGCGSLRAMHQLLHGHFIAAWRFNALLLLALPFLCWFGARCGLNTWRGRPTNVSWSGRGSWIALVLVVAFSVWRNLPGNNWAAIP